MNVEHRTLNVERRMMSEELSSIAMGVRSQPYLWPQASSLIEKKTSHLLRHSGGLSRRLVTAKLLCEAGSSERRRKPESRLKKLDPGPGSGSGMTFLSRGDGVRIIEFHTSKNKDL